MEEHSSETSEEKTVIGPVLPPHLLKRTDEESLKKEEQPGQNFAKETEDSRNSKSSIGPALPPHLLKKKSEDESTHEKDNPPCFGPQIPPHLMKRSDEESLKNEDKPGPNFAEDSIGNTKSSIGPALPPHLLKKKSEHESTAPCFGPQIPQHLRQKLQEATPPTLEESESEDEDVYGPLPPAETAYSKSQLALEERALQLKMDQLDPQQSKATVREEWMLELPAVKAANLGLGPRQFRSKAGPDFSDRSSWTDTPNKKKQKKEVEVDLKKEAEMKEIWKRDEEQEKISKKHKKKNKESLLELHQSEMKKKKKDEAQGERRPFSRDIDLQVNRFDEAQKKAILKKAQLLDDRFSSGQSKFL